MMDERFLKMSETSKLIKKLRGEGLVEVATALIVIVVMCQILGVRIEGFMKNDKVDLPRCYDQVNRRASEIGCTDFKC